MVPIIEHINFDIESLDFRTFDELNKEELKELQPIIEYVDKERENNNDTYVIDGNTQIGFNKDNTISKIIIILKLVDDEEKIVINLKVSSFFKTLNSKASEKILMTSLLTQGLGTVAEKINSLLSMIISQTSINVRYNISIKDLMDKK